MRNNTKKLENVHDFDDQFLNAKSDIQKCIKYLKRKTNKNKFNYNQLRYIFRKVREACEVEVVKIEYKIYELAKNDELTSFYKNINKSEHMLIFQVLELTGLRVSELCSLKIQDINFEENLIFIKEGKGNKDRVVPIGNKLMEKLQIYLEKRNNKYLFESNRNSKYSTRRIEQLAKKYSEGLNCKITPHTFRHLYFSFLASNNISKEYRKIIAGHSSDKTQDIYTHLTLEGIKDVVINLIDRK